MPLIYTMCVSCFSDTSFEEIFLLPPEFTFFDLATAADGSPAAPRFSPAAGASVAAFCSTFFAEVALPPGDR